jgi:hypothetical protein
MTLTEAGKSTDGGGRFRFGRGLPGKTNAQRVSLKNGF